MFKFLENYLASRSINYGSKITPGADHVPEWDGYYGGGRTWHQTGLVNVELHEGKVVSVWFRCRTLPFDQTEVSRERAREMDDQYLRVPQSFIAGIQFDETRDVSQQG